ncbi:hypothetical protein [Nocardia pseudobrasiliensis]|uniref:Uncharacterized protein n=1 Tax=Nocardia pseudobrasiliensis TaxID=45979 RepID=A0A370ICN9_9NOCA|nr:hypothetical protein [Nocardia pseudobrasiliensis]RDI68473.1 hypothetical protein DFR76_1018 [Nocardia pseudobrasiliensis]
MRTRNLSRMFGVPALAAVPLLVGAVPAEAAPDGQSWDTIFTAARSGLCVGRIDPGIGYGGLANGAALFNFQATLWGVGDCRVTITADWRNTDNGRSGSVSQEITGPGYHHYGAEPRIYPGPGHITVTFTMDALSAPAPAHGEWLMPQLPGDGS